MIAGCGDRVGACCGDITASNGHITGRCRLIIQTGKEINISLYHPSATRKAQRLAGDRNGVATGLNKITTGTRNRLYIYIGGFTGGTEPLAGGNNRTRTIQGDIATGQVSRPIAGGNHIGAHPNTARTLTNRFDGAILNNIAGTRPKNHTAIGLATRNSTTNHASKQAGLHEGVACAITNRLNGVIDRLGHVAINRNDHTTHINNIGITGDLGLNQVTVQGDIATAITGTITEGDHGGPGIDYVLGIGHFGD